MTPTTTPTLTPSSMLEDSVGEVPTLPDGLGAVNGPLARTLLDLAVEVERQEREIKLAVLAAAQAGDAPRAARLVRRWLDRPVSEVLSEPPEPASSRARMDGP